MVSWNVLDLCQSKYAKCPVDSEVYHSVSGPQRVDCDLRSKKLLYTVELVPKENNDHCSFQRGKIYDHMPHRRRALITLEKY